MQGFLNTLGGVTHFDCIAACFSIETFGSSALRVDTKNIKHW